MFDSYESSVGERIRYYRKRAQLTQKQLAEACGITEPAIRNYELGNPISFCCDTDVRKCSGIFPFCYSGNEKTKT